MDLSQLDPATFWAKIHRHHARPDSCWVWLGRKDDKGYGQFHPGGVRRSYGAHRIAYTLVMGPIPNGLQLDHLCRRPECVNPQHLEPVTHRENQLRGNTIMARNIAKTHCPQGHPYSGQNLRITASGQRICRTCSVAATIAAQTRRAARGPVTPPKTHCKRGHLLNEENLYVNQTRGIWGCRQCHRQASQAHKQRRKQKVLGDS